VKALDKRREDRSTATSHAGCRAAQRTPTRCWPKYRERLKEARTQARKGSNSARATRPNRTKQEARERAQEILAEAAKEG